MRGVVVVTHDGTEHVYENALTFHVDDRGYLHIEHRRGYRLAAFAPGHWVLAEDREGQPPAEPAAQPA